MPIDYPDYCLHLLEESEALMEFPEESLVLIDRAIDEQSSGYRENLVNCINMISRSLPEIINSPMYIKLEVLTRR